MASNRRGGSASEGSKRQENILEKEDSTISQWERARKESARILESITGNSKGLYSKISSSWSKKRRLPQLFHINNNNSILIILQGDITKTKVDAIVNAANEHMTGGGGVDGIIHRAAGDQLYDACKAHKQVSRGVRLPTGHSRILLSYDMSSTTYYIINTSGPVYYRNKAKICEDELFSCYKTSLALADLYDLESIGFTAISCGIFGYPADDGADVALRAVDKHAASVPVVVFVLWDDDIYDAWERKAKEFKFTPYDPTAEVLVKNPEPPTSKNDQEQSSKKFNPNVTDLSTQDERKKPDKTIKHSIVTYVCDSSDNEDVKPTEHGKTDESIESSILRLPCVPKDSLDTQPVEPMDDESGSPIEKPSLTTGASLQMGTMGLGNDDSMTKPDSGKLDVSEGNDQSKDDKTMSESNSNDAQPSVTTETSGEQKRKHTE